MELTKTSAFENNVERQHLVLGTFLAKAKGSYESIIKIYKNSVNWSDIYVLNDKTFPCKTTLSNDYMKK